MRLKGEILMEKGDWDSARYYLKKGVIAEDIYTRANSFNALYKLEKEQGLYEQACIYADSFIHCWNLANAMISYEQAQTFSKNYDFEVKKRELAQQQTRHYLILSACIITIILAYFSYLQFRKRKKKEEELQAQALEFDSKIKAMNEYIEAKFGKVAPTPEAIGNFRRERYRESVKAFRASSWQERLSVITPEQEREKYMNAEEQTELFKAIDRLFADFIYDLRRHYPKMNEGDIYYCVLTLLQYRSKTISYITHLSMDALRSRKSRLKKCLSADDFDFIFGGKAGEASSEALS